MGRTAILFVILCVGTSSLAMAAEDPTLRRERVESWRGRTFVHERQLHHGVPVVGASRVVTLDRDGQVTAETSTLRDGLTVGVVPTLDAATAGGLATAAVPGVVEAAHEAGLAVVPTASGGVLVYRVEVFTAWPRSAWRVTVDAHSGAVRRVDELRLAAEGDVYETNPVNSPDPITVTLEGLTGDASVMTGSHAHVTSIGFDGEEPIYVQHAVADQDGNFFYEPDDQDPEDAFVEVHAYYHVTAISQWFEDELGHEFGAPAQVWTNFREEEGGEYMNAFYTFDQLGNTIIALGQCSKDFGYDADAIDHEFGHSVVDDQAPQLLSWSSWDEYGSITAPGAIHEGFADYWSATFLGDPIMGEYSLNWPAYASYPRDLTNDNTCPADLVDEEHHDGLIVGGTAWQIRERIGAELADQVMYAMLGGLPEGTSFRSVAEGISARVADLVADGELTQADADAVEQILTERGMYTCGRSLPLELDVPHEVALDLRWGELEYDADQCEGRRERGRSSMLPFQLELRIPDDQGPLEALDIQLEMVRQDGNDIDEDDLFYQVMLRKDELVLLDSELHTTDSGHEYEVPIPGAYDVLAEEQPASLHFELDGDLALQAGATYYLQLLHINCAAVDLAITASATFGEVEGDDDAADDDDAAGDDDDGDGCSCRVAGADTAVPSAVLLALLLAAALRRRLA